MELHIIPMKTDRNVMPSDNVPQVSSSPAQKALQFQHSLEPEKITSGQCSATTQQ